MAKIDEEEADPGLNPAMDSDDTPDEISVFLSANAIGEKYQMVLKELPNGGKPQYIKSFSNYHPTIDQIGEQWGPAEYEITFSWQERGIDGKKKPVAKSFRIELSEKAWREPHEKYLAAKSKQREQERQTQLNIEVERARAFGSAGMQAPGTQADKPQSELDILTKAMQTLKNLGVPIGGPAIPAAPPPKDWGAILVGLAPVIAAVAPILAAYVGKKREENPLMTLLVTKMLDQKPQGESDTMKTVVPFLMGTMKQLFEMKEAMKPEEKEPFIERVFDKLAASMPMVLEFAKMGKQQREANPMYNMARNSPEAKAVMADPELQEMMVNRLDTFYGYEQANQVLEVMGIPRPPSTVKNAQAYPSPGTAEAKASPTPEEAAAAQETLRGAPPKVDDAGEDSPTE